MIGYQFFKHGKSSPKQKHKAIIVFVFNESADLDGVWRLYKYHIWYFGLHFSNIGYWGRPSKANNTMLGYSIAKKWKWYCQHNQKNIILWEKLKIIWKNSKWPRDITSRFFRRKERRKAAGHVGVFCQNLARYHGIYFRKLFQL